MRIVRTIVNTKSKVYKCSSLFWDIGQCRLVVTDVSGQSVGSIFKGQRVQSWTKHHSTSRNIQKSEDLFLTASEA